MEDLNPEQEDYLLEQGREEDYNKKERAKEFLNCLGNGKTIYQCEDENDFLDDTRTEDEKQNKTHDEWEME